jgi:acyl-CoA reductase-like NAD-dependent aldehyde dehydrogenase
VKDVPVDTSLKFAPASSSISYEPLGVALIYGSWNYPFIVTLKPLAQAITAGNLAILKPSEMAPASSALMKELVEKYLDRDAFAVLEGGPEICIELQKHHVDLISFTGSSLKGKLVAEAAGRHLTPCILELGGKCPVVIDESADLDLAAGKVVWARFNNSGQTCLATDYALVHQSIQK